MTPQQFIDALGDYYGKDLSEKQVVWYLRDLGKVTCNLEDLWEIVRRECRYQPRLSEILELVAELGIDVPKKTKVTSLSEYNISSCPLCHGCGFLEVWHELDGFKPGAVRAVFGGVGDEDRLTYRSSANERAYVYRCNCDDGHGKPKAWPVYRGTRHIARRDVPVESSDEHREYVERVVAQFQASEPRVVEVDFDDIPF